jgi:putative phosphoribosyl transferase
VKRFVDRADAGRLLGDRLSAHPHDETLVVLGLPRGGVVVAYEVARVLHVPLDIVIVRKVGVPFQPELAMGALAEGSVSIRMTDVCDSLHISKEEYSRAATREQLELERRVRRYRKHHGAFDLAGRTAIVVDDGVATGATARAAAASVRARGADRVALAAPIAGAVAAKELVRAFDDIVVLVIAHGPFSVGSYYERFEQTSDREVSGYLTRSRCASTSAPSTDVSDGPRRRSAHIRRSP